MIIVVMRSITVGCNESSFGISSFVSACSMSAILTSYMGIISFMFTILSILRIRRAQSPGSSMMLNPFMCSVSIKSSFINMPIGVMLNRRFLGSFLSICISVKVANARSVANM